MRRKPIGLRLEKQTIDILKAIAEASREERLHPRMKVTALIEKAVDLYIDKFRRERKYRPVIEAIERSYAEGAKLAPRKRLVVMAPRKPVQSTQSITAYSRYQQKAMAGG